LEIFYTGFALSWISAGIKDADGIEIYPTSNTKAKETLQVE